MDVIIHCGNQNLVEMRPSELAAELADQKEERLGKSGEHVPEAASSDSCPASNEAGGQTQVVPTFGSS